MTPLGSEPVTLRRLAPGSRDALGRWVEGAATDSAISMSVQPLSDADRMELDALGLRARVQRKGYTTTEVRTVSQYTEASADRIVVDSVVYVCIASAWERAVLRHHKVWLSRLDETAS